MKNTEKEITDRFQKFDFDPNERKQKQIFNKITAPKKKTARNFKFVFAAALGVIVAVIMVNKEHVLNKYDTASSVESDISVVKSSEKDENALQNANYGDDKMILQAMEEKLAESPKSPAPAVAKRTEKFAEAAIPAPASAVREAQEQRYYNISPAAAEATGKSSEKLLYEYEAKSAISQESGKAELSYKTDAGAAAKRSESGVITKSRPPAVAKRFAKAQSSKGIYSEASAVPAGAIAYYAEPDYNSMSDESYKKYEENSFRSTVSDPLSTFSADVDMASYNIVRRVIMSGNMPNPDSVRIEEFLNYFDYSYPQPAGSDPVSMNFEYTDSPWNKGLKLVKIGVKAKDIEKANLPPSNMVFLIDVSGSMSSENRLPLVKKSLKMLVGELRPEDRVSIVTYANGVNELLSGAKGSEKEKITGIIDNLDASGGTSGSEGLAAAYETAKKNFIRKGNNRVILATDGDFNIGPRSESELENQITEARKSGVFLSVLGYGMGNYKDSKIQTLANKGNGNYAYINDLFEARKTLVKEFGATLFTVAKDVKLQVEFNPSFVTAYRLVGYEKRALNTQDFNDDTKDAGEMGAGHTVTVIYEIIPAGTKSEFMPDVENLKYTKSAEASENDDLLTLKLRYKDPDSGKSKLMERTLKQKDYAPFDKTSNDMRFAASVAQFGQIVKGSKYKGDMTIDEVIKTAKRSKGADEEGYRSDFIKMAEMYQMISR